MKKKLIFKRFLLLVLFCFSSSSILSVSVEAENGVKFHLKGFVNGMYSHKDRAMHRTYKPWFAKRQTSIKDTKSNGGFRDELTRLDFGVTRMVGGKKVTGRVQWDFSNNSNHFYRIAFISVKVNPKLDILFGRFRDIFSSDAPFLGPYMPYSRSYNLGGGFTYGGISNQFRLGYKVNDNLKVVGAISGARSDKVGTIKGDYDQQPKIGYNVIYKKNKNKLFLAGFYKRSVGSRPDLNDTSIIPFSKDLPNKLASITGCPSDQGYSPHAKDKNGNVISCKKARSLFYDGVFNEAYYLYYPQIGYDKLGYDYESFGYAIEDEYKINDKNKFTVGLQTAVNMNAVGFAGAQRYSVLSEVNASLIGQYSKVQDYLNGKVYNDITGRHILGSIYQTKSIKQYHVHFASFHKLSQKVNLSTWIGQSKIMNAKDLKPANASEDTNASGSLKRATSLAYAGSKVGAIVENNLFQYIFEYTPFKGEINNLKFFFDHSHFQTTYANTEVQNNASLAAILPYMEKENKEEARNIAFENSLRQQAGKTAIVNKFLFGAVYMF